MRQSNANVTSGSNVFLAAGLCVNRGRRQILCQANLQVRPGEVLCLLGANGAGKSTMLSAFAGEIKAASEADQTYAVQLNGRELCGLDAAQQARCRAVLPQKPGLAFDLEVTEVIAMGAYPFPSLTQSQVDALTETTLQHTQLTHLAKRRDLELSGGEQQRVQFARVVLQVLAEREADRDGRYLLLDEPTASLDPLHQQMLLKMVAELAQSERIGVLVILHDVNLAALWCDRIALLSQGAVLACGEPSDVLTPENIYKVYGVQVHIMPHPMRPQRPLVVFG